MEVNRRRKHRKHRKRGVNGRMADEKVTNMACNREKASYTYKEFCENVRRRISEETGAEEDPAQVNVKKEDYETVYAGIPDVESAIYRIKEQKQKNYWINDEKGGEDKMEERKAEGCRMSWENDENEEEKNVNGKCEANETGNAKLAPPWVTYYHEVEGLFKGDPEVTVLFDEEKPEIKLLVDNKNKADALQVLLPERVDFGNVVLHVTIAPSNGSRTMAELFAAAFKGNDVVRDVVYKKMMFGDEYFVVFKKGILQFYNDEMYDLHGVKSMLYADAAKDVFRGAGGVHFNTDSEGMNEPEYIKK